MKFHTRFDKSKIPAWKDFYVSYDTLTTLVSPFKVMVEGNIHK